VTQIYCNVSTSSLSNSTAQNNCSQLSCNLDQVASPNCKCAYPYKGTLFFRALFSFDLGNLSYYAAVEESIKHTLMSYELPVDSVSLSNPTIDSLGDLRMEPECFPIKCRPFQSNGNYYDWLCA
jgi:hypothetical protein